MKILLSVFLLFFICTESKASVYAKRYPTDTAVLVCQPSDTDSNCGGGGGSGNVGIGTTGWNAYYASSSAVVTASNAIFTDTNKNVGINSVSPGQRLDIQGTLRTTAFTLSTNPSSGYVLTTNSVGVGTWAPTGNSSQWVTTNTNDVYLPNNGNVGIGTSLTTTSALTIMNGNVGIGTWKPIAPITIPDQFGATIRITNPSQLNLDSQVGGWHASSETDLVAGSNFYYDAAGNAQRLNTSYGSAGFITQASTSNGLVLLFTGSGSGSATSKFGVNAAGNATLASGGSIVSSSAGFSPVLGAKGTIPGFTLSPTSGDQFTIASNGVAGLVIYDETAGAYRLSIDNNGNVGIGSQTPGTKLDIQGTIRSLGFSTSGGYTQSGTSPNTFTGATTLSAAGTALTVTNSALISGKLGIGTDPSTFASLYIQPTSAPTVPLTYLYNASTINNATPSTWLQIEQNNPSKTGSGAATQNLVSSKDYMTDSGSGAKPTMNNLYLDTQLAGTNSNGVSYIRGLYTQTYGASTGGTIDNLLAIQNRFGGNGSASPVTITNAYGMWNGIDTYSASSTVAITNEYDIYNGVIGNYINTSVTNRYADFIANNTPGSGSSQTNQYGLYVQALTGGTNNAGVVIGEATGTKSTDLLIGTTTQPSGNFAIHSVSTQPTYIIGNVGINTLTPGQKLDVNGTLRLSGQYSVNLGTDNKAQIGASAATTPDITFTTNSTEIVRITNSGNVGIGSTTPGQKLDVQGTLRVFNNVGIGVALPTNALSVSGAIDTSGNTSNSYLNSTGGNVGIGSVTPGQKLDVIGDIRGNGFSGATAGDILCVKSNGAIGSCGVAIVGTLCTCS